MVSPCEGVVPSRGLAPINIHFNPDCVLRFDAKIEIALRNMKSIELRVAGSVEPPNVDISVVASHDFYLPLMINGVKWPTDSLSPFSSLSSSSTSPSLTADSRNHIKAYPYSVTMATQQPLWIQATALYAPLEMSPTSLQFNVEQQFNTYSKNVELKAVCEESVCWRAVKGQCVYWWFDCSVMSVLTQGTKEQQLCEVSPSSGSLKPGQTVRLVVTINPEVVRMGEKVTKLSVPLCLGVNGEERNKGHPPYRELSVTITFQLPSITFHPLQILFTPVPLARSIETTLILLAEGYQSGTRISAEVDEVEMKDETKIQPVSVIFPEGNTIHAQHHNQQESKVTSLLCSVSFCSAVPLSLSTTITFTDHMNNRFLIKLCAVADNCLLTVWPYMALHPSDQQIVLKTGITASEAVLQYCHTPLLTDSDPTASSSSSSSSSFNHNSSTYKNSDSFSYSNSVSEQSSGDTYISANRETPTNLGIPEFPSASTEAGQYYQSVLLAVERWFSLYGWPSGPHPISIPHTLRRIVSKSQTNHTKGRTYSVILNKDTRSVVEMLHYLTDRQIPGIGLCQTFSSDIDQRTNQLLQQHEAMLAFLRVQGACLCHIRPEYLLDVLEFKHWCSLQSSDTETGLYFNSFDFESLSKRCWTDVLLQIYKVKILPLSC
ncbi:cilia- and flagella-associated protein 47-like [Kryptolebias marmoratus]|uniref:cilia- and flagella-associated protein 47-like n=1 Tax=Kryptolebias marmoratus TaxID=37003 RepID=UPI0018AC9C70|nr:cilia- and flagella-associated protein 47-like [Kryptolebias marmoratus]